MEIRAQDMAPPGMEVREMIEPEVVQQLRMLSARGWGSKRIAAELGIARNTVKRYLHGALAAEVQVRPGARRLDEDARSEARQMFVGLAEGNAVVVRDELARRGIEASVRTRTELTRCKMRRSGDYVDSGEGWARPAGRGKAFVWLIRRLWMNSLQHFKGMEDAGDGRADRYEGTGSWLQPSQLGEIQFGDIRIPASELAGPVVIQYNHLNSLNVLCLYAATSGSFDRLSNENLPAFKEYMRIPQSTLDMGKFAVLVHKPKVFQNRAMEAAKREGFGLTGKLVDYFDSEAFSGNVPQPLFAKQHGFSSQREYRFALDRGIEECNPYTLDVGPLGDVCAIVDATSINDQLSLSLPDAPRE
jgi:predicted transcriptional regulator